MKSSSPTYFVLGNKFCLAMVLQLHTLIVAMPIDCRSSKSRNGASRESTAVVNSTELGLLNNVLKDLSVVHFFSFVDDSVFVDLQFEYLQSGSLCHITGSDEPC